MHVNEIIAKYSAEEAELPSGCLIITINKSYDESEQIYFGTRFAWKANLKNASKVKIVFSVVRGVIKEVFEVDKWAPATKDNFSDILVEEPNRIAFEGKVANKDLREKFKDKRIPERFQKRGAANPLRYT